GTDVSKRRSGGSIFGFPPYPSKTCSTNGQDFQDLALSVGPAEPPGRRYTAIASHRRKLTFAAAKNCATAAALSLAQSKPSRLNSGRSISRSAKTAPLFIRRPSSLMTTLVRGSWQKRFCALVNK